MKVLYCFEGLLLPEETCSEVGTSQHLNLSLCDSMLQRLAGGTLLYRDKQCFVLYRGKDFLPPAVQAALEEREAMARSWQEDEERVRMGGRSYSMPIIESQTEDRCGRVLYVCRYGYL